MKPKMTNPELMKVIRLLREKSNETGAAIWDDTAERLSKSKHKRVCVNVSRINRHADAGETVLIPGRVLGSGAIQHAVHVGAFNFSEQARKKILKAKGKCLSIPELVKKNPTGSKIKMIG